MRNSKDDQIKGLLELAMSLAYDRQKLQDTLKEKDKIIATLVKEVDTLREYSDTLIKYGTP